MLSGLAPGSTKYEHNLSSDCGVGSKESWATIWFCYLFWGIGHIYNCRTCSVDDTGSLNSRGNFLCRKGRNLAPRGSPNRLSALARDVLRARCALNRKLTDWLTDWRTDWLTDCSYAACVWSSLWSKTKRRSNKHPNISSFIILLPSMVDDTLWQGITPALQTVLSY